MHYPIPLNRQPAVVNAAACLPVGDALAQQVLSLPMHPYLDAQSQQAICAAIARCAESLAEPVAEPETEPQAEPELLRAAP
ncbi:UDP-2-acetamido-2-deoxy-3-oxo-D-glucuronate aminotransferase [compost metagenome]